jgi:hypothetical protein
VDDHKDVVDVRSTHLEHAEHAVRQTEERYHDLLDTGSGTYQSKQVAQAIV